MDHAAGGAMPPAEERVQTILSARVQPLCMDLVIDFGPIFTAVGVAISLIPLAMTESVLLSFISGGIAVAGGLVWLGSRSRKLFVVQQGDVVEIRNMLWTHHVGRSDVRSLTLRHSWLGGMYCECVAIRIRRRPLSLPIHASQCPDMRQDPAERLKEVFPRATWRRNRWLWL